MSRFQFVRYQLRERFATIELLASNGRPDSILYHGLPPDGLDIKQGCCKTYSLYNNCVVKVKRCFR
ncbi:MAG: hypothetical protein ACREX4_20655, partial [Gammaproteobacteria bacterium]